MHVRSLVMSKNNRYNAEREKERGRMTHDDIGRVRSFGPGRDHRALSQAVFDVLKMTRDVDGGGRMMERTERGKQYRMPPGLARIIGVETGEWDRETGGATVHGTLDAITRYVGASALPPEQIVPDIREQLAPKEEPAAETVPMPIPEAAEPVPEPGVTVLQAA